MVSTYCGWCVKLLLSLSGLWAQALYVPDTVSLAEVVEGFAVGTRLLPQGPECLGHTLERETLRVQLRFWEGPGTVSWKWAGETLRTIVVMGSLPPDSLMPQGDFSVPALSDALTPRDSFPLEWLWIGLAVVLSAPLWAPAAYRAFRRAVRPWYLALRWRYFLWKWRPAATRNSFSAFLSAVKELLRPHASFHPGSLTLSEAQALQGVSQPLQEALVKLLQVEIEESFLGKGLSFEEKQNAWGIIWRKLREATPSGRETLLLHR